MSDLTTYNSDSFNIISNANILEKEDFNKLSELKDELNDNFLHSQIFRTRTEMEVSVLDDLRHPTPDNKYWQSQREQKVHFNELVMLSYDYRKNLIEIEQLKRKYDKEEDDLERELIKIEIDRKSFISKNQERLAKDRIREIQQWHEIKADLIPKMEYSLTDVNEHQLINYAVEFVKQFINMSDRITHDEKLNLLGKLTTTLKKCKNDGLLDKLYKKLNDMEIRTVQGLI